MGLVLPQWAEAKGDVQLVVVPGDLGSKTIRVVLLVSIQY